MMLCNPEDFAKNCIVFFKATLIHQNQKNLKSIYLQIDFTDAFIASAAKILSNHPSLKMTGSASEIANKHPSESFPPG